MAYDKRLFERLGVKIDISDAQNRFMNRLRTILFKTTAFNNDKIKLTQDSSIYLSFCIKIGIVCESLFSEIEDSFNTKDFTKFVINLNALMDVLKEKNPESYELLLDYIERFITDSEMDLGIHVVTEKKKEYLVYRGSELLDKKLISDSLNILDKAKAVIVSFERGLKEYLAGHSDTSRYHNTVRDMQVSLDECAKIILSDKNTGIKHLVKNEHWTKTGLNEYYKQIVFQLNDMIDKLAKHKADYIFEDREVESIVYMTGLIIRLLISK